MHTDDNINNPGNGINGSGLDNEMFSQVNLIEKIKVAVISVDLDYNILTWNKAAENIYGWKAEEVMGKPVREILNAEFPNSGFADSISLFFKKGYWEGEVLHQRKDGVKIWILASTVLLKNAEGNPIGMVSINHDITGRIIIEESLQKSEERYKRITNGLTDYLYTVKVENGKAIDTTHSNTCTEVTGYSPRDFIDDPYLWIMMVVPDDREMVTNRVQRILSNEDLPPIEHRIIRKDGEIRWVVDTTIPHHDENGFLISYDGVIKDITKRLSAEQAGKQAEEKFTKAFNFNLEAIAITSAVDMRIIDVNNIFLKASGFERGEIIGHSAFELDFWVSTTERDNYFNLLSSSGSVRRFETEFKTKNGEIRYAQISSEFTEIAGEKCFLHFVHDITDSKIAEEELNRSENLFRSVWESSRDGMRLTDKEGIILKVNQAFCELCGKSKDELEGKYISEIYLRDSGEKILKAYQENFTNKNIKPYIENEYSLWNGVNKWLAVSTSVLDHNHSTLLSIFRDITERKQVEDALQESETRFRSLLQDVKHVAVQGYAPDGTTQYWNEASELLYGYSVQEAIGRNLVDLIIPPEMRGDVENAIKQMAETGQPIPAMELSLMRKDGSRVAVFSSHTIVNVPGRMQELFCIDVDLTERKHVEEELRESEQRFSVLSEAAFEGIVISDNGQVIDVNQQMSAMFGYEQSGMINLKVENFVAPESQELVMQHMLSGSEDPYEHIALRKDGSAFPVEIRAKSLPYKGSVVRVTAVRDITERKQAEDALRESELKYRSLIENSSDVTFCVNEKGEYQFTNNIFASTFGKTPDYFIGKTFWDIYPKEDADHRQAVNLKVFETGVTQSVEVKVPLPDRTLYFIAKANPIKDETGKVILNLTTAIDITERKYAEDLLKESEARFRSFMENMPDLVLIKDNNLRPTFFNKKFFEVFPGEEWLGKTPHEIFPQDIADVMNAEDRRALNGEPVLYEENWQGKNGQSRVFETRKFAINLEGAPPLLGAIISDITERKHAEEKIKKSLKEKEVLLKEIHHRVKNNFQIINSLLNLQNDLIEDPKTSAIFKDSQNRIRSMSLTHELMYRSGDFTGVKAKDYIESLIEHLSYSFTSHNNSIKFALAIDDVSLDMDTIMSLGLMVNEVVSNSIKHAFPGNNPGEINILLKESSAEEYLLRISDNGIGLPESMQMDKLKSLGMQLIHTLVRQIRGKLNIESSGNGTVIEISFK